MQIDPLFLFPPEVLILLVLNVSEMMLNDLYDQSSSLNISKYFEYYIGISEICDCRIYFTTSFNCFKNLPILCEFYLCLYKTILCFIVSTCCIVYQGFLMPLTGCHV